MPFRAPKWLDGSTLALVHAGNNLLESISGLCVESSWVVEHFTNGRLGGSEENNMIVGV